MSTPNSFFRQFLLLVVAGLFFSCGNSKGPTIPLPTDQATLALIEKGERLIAVNCYACHSQDAPLNGRLAPPMAAVRSHYLDESSTFNGFKEELIRFVQKPSEAYSKMPGARKRFGLMPALALPEEELEAIAAYIFYTDVDAPEWLEEHQKEELKSLGAKDDLVEQGRSYALQTKAALGKKLMAALNTRVGRSVLKLCVPHGTRFVFF